MKRSVVGILCSGVLIAAIGCGGGTMEEGVPKDLTPGVPIDSIKANMAVPGAKKPGEGQMNKGEAPKP
jgi:hypothetical protein